MLSDGIKDQPFFLGMGFAGAEIITDANPAFDLILPETVERPTVPKRELGFNAAKAWQVTGHNQREYQRARTQSD
jgi:hypothetical protein